VAALGDSITAGTPLWDPDPARRAQIAAPDPRSQYGYWAERALGGTDFRNCGVPGELTGEIERRLERCARAADVLVVQGGLNDIAAGVAPAVAARNLRDMVRRGRRLGLEVALVELLPWNGGHPQADGPIRRLNREIARIGAQEDVPVSRWYRVVEDPRRPGRMRAEWTIDLVHPTVRGYRRLGEALVLP
jgi:lysophospholipase L1-like esterase